MRFIDLVELDDSELYECAIKRYLECQIEGSASEEDLQGFAEYVKKSIMDAVMLDWVFQGAAEVTSVSGDLNFRLIETPELRSN